MQWRPSNSKLILYNYLIIYFITIKPVNDCDECFNAGGRSMHISLSLICKRCDLGINACYKSKRCRPRSYIGVSIIIQFLFTL